VSDRAVYWRLTPAGDAYLVRLTAIRRGSHPEADGEDDADGQEAALAAEKG
jgi:hypothetical protein